jgi:FAD/FMN-containing dehydrogenase
MRTALLPLPSSSDLYTTRFGQCLPNVVNDRHSRLNQTTVAQVHKPRTLEHLASTIAQAKRRGGSVIAAGGRHAMGGQQFRSGGNLIDTRGLNQLIAFDPARAQITVEAGITWPELLRLLLQLQTGWNEQLTIAQKQTGADNLSLGGALSANIHGRGLKMRPMIGDIEAFELVNADGDLVRCSRTENSDLFRLAIGGYGLFGCIYSVTLRLVPRHKVQRVVTLLPTNELHEAFQARIGEGFLFGDFQFAIDPCSPDFLNRGVFSCYKPVPKDRPIPGDQLGLTESDFLWLLELAHRDKTAGFEEYAKFYEATSGQIYWSDLHQFGTYVEDYHARLDQKLAAKCAGSEMITELYVPRSQIAEFLQTAAGTLRERRANLIYGTVRLIERDTESFLPWAREDWACVVFNLHVDHDPEGIKKAIGQFQALIDCAIDYKGSYYLTYHRWATAEQVLSCYPEIGGFFQAKKLYDPEETFCSTWYSHYQQLLQQAFPGVLANGSLANHCGEAQEPLATSELRYPG